MVFSLLSGLPLWVCRGTERAQWLALVILAPLAAQDRLAYMDPPVSWAVSGLLTDTQGMQRYSSSVWSTEISNTWKKKNPLFKLPGLFLGFHEESSFWAWRHFLQMSLLLMAAVRVHVGICTKSLIWYFSSDCNEDWKVSFRASFLFVLWKMKRMWLSINEIITCLLH